jgi:hypothetical protein
MDASLLEHDEAGEKAMLNEWPNIYQRIKGMHVSVAEKVQIARGLAATPDERSQMNVERCKELGIWGKGLEGKRELERLVVAGKLNWTKNSVERELRNTRDEHAARFGYDIDAIARDLQEKEKTAGRKMVNLKPRKLAKK